MWYSYLDERRYFVDKDKSNTLEIYVTIHRRRTSFTETCKGWQIIKDNPVHYKACNICKISLEVNYDRKPFDRKITINSTNFIHFW